MLLISYQQTGTIMRYRVISTLVALGLNSILLRTMESLIHFPSELSSPIQPTIPFVITFVFYLTILILVGFLLSAQTLKQFDRVRIATIILLDTLAIFTRYHLLLLLKKQ